MTDFSEKIATIAKEKFGSQKKMAEALNLEPTTVTAWVKGRSKPSLDVIIELCKKTNTSLDWLVLGQNFEADSLDLELFNQVFALAYKYALSNKLAIDGNYFLACYDFINQEKKKNPKESIESIFKRLQPIIKKFRK